MAKKAKKAKAAKARKQATPTPTYLKGTKPVNVPAHQVADVFALIHKHGHAAKFKRQAKAAGVAVTLNPETVNFVKDFLANNTMHKNAIGQRVVNSDGTFSCT
jgi:hypothetical protein